MSEKISDNKTIAKNTLLLYFRMLFTMVVSLYTSRVVLQTLGVDDFGIYQAVGGVVGMLSFINGALGVGSSRFLTYELGRGDKGRLKLTFSTTLLIHVAFALIVLLVGETVGLWFVYNKLVIAPERMDAALIAYHLSILTAMFTLTQVPYSSSIISHERMDIYAYMTIIEVSLKLGIVYLLTIGSWDKLALYASLLCAVQIGLALFYRYYCSRHFEETHFQLKIDKKIFLDVLSMSGWNLFANTAIALNTQGMVILINMFFSPAVVTARAVANQVNMAANQFVQNFRIAANPQIVKRLAAGDEAGSHKLLLQSTKYSYYMMLLLSLPICLVAEPLIQLWLGQIPPYTVVFLQLSIVTSLFQVFDTSFYTALYAKGRIRENAMISPTILFLSFLLIYVLFRMGYSPVCLAWVMLGAYALIGMLLKPILIIKIANYTWKDIFSVYVLCARVTMLALPIPLFLYHYQYIYIGNLFLRFIALTAVSVISVSAAVWLTGIDKPVKTKIISYIKNKVYKK